MYSWIDLALELIIVFVQNLCIHSDKERQEYKGDIGYLNSKLYKKSHIFHLLETLKTGLR